MIALSLSLHVVVVTQVLSLFRDVSSNEARANVVHDVFKAAWGDGGSKDVQDDTPRCANFVVDYLILGKKGD